MKVTAGRDLIKDAKRKIITLFGRQLLSIEIWLLASLTLQEFALDRGWVFRARNVP